MNKKCPKCGSIPVSGTMYCNYFDADQEPYEAGKEELPKSGYKEIRTQVRWSAKYCETCNAFISIEISEAPMI